MQLLLSLFGMAWGLKPDIYFNKLKGMGSSDCLKPSWCRQALEEGVLHAHKLENHLYTKTTRTARTCDVTWSEELHLNVTCIHTSPKKCQNLICFPLLEGRGVHDHGVVFSSRDEYFQVRPVGTLLPRQSPAPALPGRTRGRTAPFPTTPSFRTAI